MTTTAKAVRVAASFALAAVLLGSGPAHSQSAGTTIFGPFTVQLPSTATFSFSRSFSVPQPVQGSYLVRVQLGTPNSLTTLSLRLNNAQIYSLSDFAGGVTRVDKVLTLAASNTLSLSVAGATGTRIAITVFTVVMPKPVSLSPDPLALNVGASGTLTATLSHAPTASGTLAVTSSNPSVASVPSSLGFASGQTSVAIPVSALAPGNATVTASANGGQASAAVNVNAPASVSLTAPSAGSVFQAQATITITAAATDPDGTVAQVDFYQGTTLIGTALTAPYTFTWTNVAAGSYSLTAVATDNQGASSTSSAVTVRVNAPPSVALTSPANGATFTAPATIALAATAADSDGNIVGVDFFQGVTFIGTVGAAPYTFNWTNVGQGSYAITARATDNDGAMTISNAVTITVNSGVAQMYYIVPDHLNTPRMIADGSGTTVWRWDQREPFGNDVPNNNPSGAGAFDFPLRFPGQYFDRETNLAYNWMRDYDPAIGRYVQSDLSGLLGGANTYLYVFARVLVGTDRSGLITCTFDPPDFNPAGCTRISKDYKDVTLTERRPDADIILATIPVPLPRIELCPTLPGSFPYIVRPCAGRTKEYDEILIGFFDVKRLYRRDDLIAVEVFKCPGPCGTSKEVTRTSTCTGTWTATDLVQRGGFGTRIYHGTLP